MSITIDLSALGNGTYTIEDDGIPGNGVSVIRDPFGNIVTTFAHPADQLTIVSRAGQDINVNITDSLTTANFTIGSLTLPSANPDNIRMGAVLTSGAVTLAARNTVNELGSDSSTDIIAGKLFLDAGTGVGTGGNFIETQVSVLEGETVSGGIRLSNINNVTIGGAGGTADLRGLFSGSGNIILVNQGAILLSDEDGIESVHSGGNLQLSAIGAAADISSNVDQDALFAVGNITLNSGRDVLFGTVGANFDNDVRAGGGITVSAARDFHIDGFSDLASDDQGLASNGGVSITAGRDILVEANNGTDASVGVSGGGSTGAVVLTTGVGGTLSLAATSSAAVFSGVGGVTVNADRVLIGSSSGISVSGGGTARLTTASAGHMINIGSAADGFLAMELSDAELDRVFADNVVIGSASAGEADVVGVITHPNANLTIESGEDVLVEADITTLGSLTLRSAENVTQSAGTITTGTLNVLVDSPDLDGFGGMNVFQGFFSTSTLNVQGEADGDTLNGAEGMAQTVHGNGGADTIISSGEGDYFGDAGDDTIFAGLTNGLVNENLDGGTGTDTLITTSYPLAYVINMATGATNFAFESFINFENLITGDGSDTITGTAGANNIQTGIGNDSIDGGAGADTMIGGVGNDTYFVDNAGDVVVENVGEGTDQVQSSVNYTLGGGVEVEQLATTNNAGITAIALTGNEFANAITGNAGNNTLTGGLGNDTLTGLAGNDILGGNQGNDTLEGGAGTDTLDGGLDIDTASYGAAASAVVVDLRITVGQNTVGAGIDTLTNIENLTGSTFADNLTGNSVDNVLTALSGNDTLTGLFGNDTLFGNQGNDTLDGGLGNDTLDGGADTDTATYAVASSGVTVDLRLLVPQNTFGAGNDTLVNVENLTGSTFADALTGNSVDNVLTGLSGNDTLTGLFGNDTLFGNEGNDALNGNQGNDTLEGGLGDDTLDGGSDTDTASYTAAAAGVTVDLRIAGAQNTVAAGSDSLVNIENLSGSVFADTLTGNSLANILTGQAGNDTLVGNFGNDTLFGNQDNDTLSGGAGNDTLDGGIGTDTFLFDAALDAATNVDTISGFSVADDTIALKQAMFSGVGALGALAASAFFTGAAAHDADDRVIYDSGTGQLFYDADGNGVGAQVQFAQLAAGLAMSAADFLVVA